MASRKRGREDGAAGDAEERELPALGGAGAPTVSIVRGRDADDEEVEEEEEDIFAEVGRAAPTTAAADGKRPRTSTELVVADASRSGALIVADASAAGLAPGRVSGLAAPTMVLEGHRGPIYGLEFSPDGAHIASASKDRSVLVWSVYGECRSTVELTGHKNAVSDVHWSSDSLSLYTASADKTAAIWDAESGARRRRYVGHAGYVHACAPARRGRELVATASDDGFCKVWDARQRTPVHSFAHEFPITSVAFADDSASVFTAGLDELIRQWDLRRGTTLLELKGHTNTVTSLALNAAGTHLASFAMDHTLRIWDVRPFVASERCTRVLTGALHNAEQQLLGCAWSPDGERVGAGSADRMALVWDVDTGRALYRLPGHTGIVNRVVFHPKEPILGSAANDGRVFLGELAK